jgi:hypothetical protein
VLLGSIVLLTAFAWGVFWLVMGRHMNNFDFAASYPAHGVEWSYTDPAYVNVMIERYAAAIIVFSAIPGVIIGVGLLRSKPWALKLGIVVSIVDIVLLFPLYLLLGIYGLVMLTKSEAREMYEQG